MLTPHVAQAQDFEVRWTHHPSYRISDKPADTKRVEEIFGWVKQSAGVGN